MTQAVTAQCFLADLVEHLRDLLVPQKLGSVTGAHVVAAFVPTNVAKTRWKAIWLSEASPSR